MAGALDGERAQHQLRAHHHRRGPEAAAVELERLLALADKIVADSECADGWQRQARCGAKRGQLDCVRSVLVDDGIVTQAWWASRALYNGMQRQDDLSDSTCCVP